MPELPDSFSNKNLHHVNIVFLGSAAGEDNYISREDAEQCETGDERVEGDVDKAEERQLGVPDAESVSSGSSIELLDISEEGHDHAAAESAVDEKDSNDENLVEVQCDVDEVGQTEMMGGVQEFADATGSESLTSEGGEVVGHVSAGIQSEEDALDMMASTVTDDGDDEMHKVAEMERSREGEQLQQNKELAQSAVMTPSPVDRPAAASHHGSIVSDVTR